MITWGSLFVIVIISVFFTDDQDAIKTILGSILLGIIPMVIGIFLLRYSNKKQKESLSKKYEHDLINLAKAKDGILTESETAVSLNISLSEARKTLHELCIKGYAYSDVNDNGVIQYFFKAYTK
jgi:hypothetical protein